MGVSAIDSLDGAVAQFARAEGLAELHRPNLSLERVREWTQLDVCRAIEVKRKFPLASMCLTDEYYSFFPIPNYFESSRSFAFFLQSLRPCTVRLRLACAAPSKHTTLLSPGPSS